MFTAGLGARDPQAAEILTAANEAWISDWCDVVALKPGNVDPQSYVRMVNAHPLFTPMLYVYAGTASERPNEPGYVGDWAPKMAQWTVRDKTGAETAPPTPQTHWMDMGRPEYAVWWRHLQVLMLKKYSAAGVVVADMPLGSSLRTKKTATYPTVRSLGEAGATFLQAIRKDNLALIVPQANGFEEVVGRITLPVPAWAEQPELAGRWWDEYFSATDGAWAEGWLRPYWTGVAYPRRLWELQMEAADRYARTGGVFIAQAAYHNDAELEYALSSYLMAWHSQGRFVFQPMPLRAGEPEDAGFNLETARREVKERKPYFDVALGMAMQERHEVPADNGMVWRRAFQYGVVYVNPDENRPRQINFGGRMRRVGGEWINAITLPPCSGVILLYPPENAPHN